MKRQYIIMQMIFTGITFLASISVALAISYNLLAPVSENVKVVSSWTDYLGGLLPFLLRFAALAAVVQIVIGGFQYAVSGVSPSQMAEGKDRMVQAILGLLLALTSYLILNTINPDLVSLKLTSLTPIDINSAQNQNTWTLQTKQSNGTWVPMTGIANNGNLSQANCQTVLNAFNDNNNYQCSPFSGQGNFGGTGAGGSF